MGGLISGGGLDVQGIVSQLLFTLRSQQVGPLQKQQTTLQAQSSAYNDLQTKLQNLLSQVTSLQTSPGSLGAQTVSTSDNTKVTGTANGNAILGSYSVSISNLATVANFSSNAFASPTTAIGASGSITVIQNGVTNTVSVVAGDTLNTLQTKFNNLGMNLNASVIQNGTQYQLTINSTVSGATNDITITNSTTPSGTLTFTKNQSGQNANLTVNGLAITSSSNSVTNALPGVTLNLINTTPVGTTVNVSVQTDTATITGAINSFVSAYSDFNSFLKAQATFDPTSGRSGPLAGNSLVNTIQANLAGLFTTTFTGNTTYQTLASMGIELQQDGSAKVNTTTLNNAINTNLAEVQRIFRQISPTKGIGQQFIDQINSAVDVAGGSITVAKQQLQLNINDILNQISMIDDRLKEKQKILIAQFSRADQALRSLSQLQATLGQLGQIG